MSRSRRQQTNLTRVRSLMTTSTRVSLSPRVSNLTDMAEAGTELEVDTEYEVDTGPVKEVINHEAAAAEVDHESSASRTPTAWSAKVTTLLVGATRGAT